MSEYAGYRRAPAVAAVVLSGTLAAYRLLAVNPLARLE